MSGNERPLAGRVALVTGAGQRLGQEIARGLASLGAELAVHFHASRAGAEELAAWARADGSRVELFEADLTRAEACDALVAAAEAKLGKVSVLVNSAAVYEPAPLDGTSLVSLERQWALNARAPFLLAQAMARRLGAGPGDIVNVLDVGGALHAWRHAPAYAMTKAALASLTQSLALALAPGIRVNAVAPGTVLPPEGLSAAAAEALQARIPQGRFGAPSDVVEVVKFLLAGPRFVTGQLVGVDGGRGIPGA